MHMLHSALYYTYCVQRENETIWEHFAYDGRLTENGIHRSFTLRNIPKQGKLYKSNSTFVFSNLM